MNFRMIFRCISWYFSPCLPWCTLKTRNDEENICGNRKNFFYLPEFWACELTYWSWNLHIFMKQKRDEKKKGGGLKDEHSDRRDWWRAGYPQERGLQSTARRFRYSLHPTAWPSGPIDRSNTWRNTSVVRVTAQKFRKKLKTFFSVFWETRATTSDSLQCSVPSFKCLKRICEQYNWKLRRQMRKTPKNIY